jgi:hypothetical protein
MTGDVSERDLTVVRRRPGQPLRGNAPGDLTGPPGVDTPFAAPDQAC